VADSGVLLAKRFARSCPSKCGCREFHANLAAALPIRVAASYDLRRGKPGDGCQVKASREFL